MHAGAINTEVDNDDDASICVHTAFSGLNGTDMCNVGMLLPPSGTSVPASCLSSQQARPRGISGAYGSEDVHS